MTGEVIGPEMSVDCVAVGEALETEVALRVSPGGRVVRIAPPPVADKLGAGVQATLVGKDLE